MQDRFQKRPDARPPHETANKNRTAESLLPKIISEIKRENWAVGAQVTATIIADRFCLSLEEGRNALSLLAEVNVLEKNGPSYFVK